ncbi:hypothetical protein [Vampirovibrio sp.]|uniref:hypothetical protein n=1 Tax=Vampirovibrio sp. TaxID=2717857 RepID=UPI003594520F
MSDTQPFKTELTPCDRTQETIFDLMEAEPVSQAEQDALSAHLGQCASCQAYQETMNTLSLSIVDLEEVPVPVGLEARIMTRIAQDDSSRSQAIPISCHPRFRWKPYGALAAAVLMLAIVIPITLKNGTPDQQNPTVAMLNGTTDEMILQQSGRPKVAPAKPSLDEVQPQSKPPVQSGKEQRDQLVTSEINPKATVSRQAPAERAAEKTVQPSDEKSDLEADIEKGTQLAFAGSMGNSLQHTYASETDGDVYYDPVSTLVGF